MKIKVLDLIFFTVYILVKIRFPRACIDLLWMWHYGKLWRHRLSYKNDSPHRCKQHWIIPNGHHRDKILDIEIDDSYWGFGRYCVQDDLIVWRQSRQHFVGQSL